MSYDVGDHFRLVRIAGTIMAIQRVADECSRCKRPVYVSWVPGITTFEESRKKGITNCEDSTCPHGPRASYVHYRRKP